MNLMDYSKYLATRTKTMDASAIRELFKVLGKPGMLSMAGGAPANSELPLEEIKDLSQEALERYGYKILQYGTTEGLIDLRNSIASLVKERGINVAGEEVCISTGAQTAIASVSHVLFNKGDSLALEAPSFLASVNGFKSYELSLHGVSLEDDGINVEELEKVIRKNKAKALYTIPNFQNPSGITLSLEKRKKILQLAEQYDFLIIEDDPYFELRYDNNHLPSLKSLAPERVIYIGSLSKTFAPGMRLGFYIAPSEIQTLMTTARQSMDVHSNNLSQAIAYLYIDKGILKKRTEKAINNYRAKRDQMLKSIKENLPKDFKFISPEGGMFIWIEAPAHYDAIALQKKCVENNVAFVPGNAFFVDKDNVGRNCFRLNFTNVELDKIEIGVINIVKFI